MNKRDRSVIHKRWIGQLRANLPEGIAIEDGWPETERRAEDGEHYVMQCLHCHWFVWLDEPGDWGVCVKEGGQYDRQAVFEHWSCLDHEPSRRRR